MNELIEAARKHQRLRVRELIKTGFGKSEITEALKTILLDRNYAYNDEIPDREVVRFLVDGGADLNHIEEGGTCARAEYGSQWETS